MQWQDWVVGLTVFVALAFFVALGAVSLANLARRKRFEARSAAVAAKAVEIIERVIEKPVAVERVVYRPLPDDLSTYRTLVEVMSALGVAPHKTLTWSLGRQAAALHVERYGVPPRKVDRAKTRGTGSHSFAAYPEEFVPELEKLIRGRAAA